MKIIAPNAIVDATLASSNVPETDYAAYAAGTTYAINAYVIYVAANVHKIYQSLIASNLGNDPTIAANSTKWLDCGSTNRWKLHDLSVQSQTINALSIANIYSVSGRCNALAALNLDAASMTVTMTDVTDGMVYNKTISLTSYAGINSWYSWFFEPIVRITDIALTDLPSYGNATVAVSFSSPSGNVAVGALILGNSKIIGATQYGMKLSTTSYSTKTQDQFGNYSITKRAYRKTADLSVLVDGSYVDQLQRLLVTYRDVPMVYLGTGIYSADLIFGFYKEASITVSYPTTSLLTINIEGLT